MARQKDKKTIRTKLAAGLKKRKSKIMAFRNRFRSFKSRFKRFRPFRRFSRPAPRYNNRSRGRGRGFSNRMPILGIRIPGILIWLAIIGGGIFMFKDALKPWFQKIFHKS